MPPAPPTPTSQNSATTAPFGSGISVYYSFKLQLLFWSYQQGKSFMGAFRPNTLVLDKVSQLSIANSKPAPTATATTTTASSVSSQQALCSWSEIPTHPGLVMAMTLLSNNPVILMFLPDKIYFQEIKLTNNQGGPSKAKIQDMVATRHPSSSASSSSSSTATISSANEDDECGDASENLNKKENFSGN